MDPIPDPNKRVEGFPLSKKLEELPRSFASREEWEAELARRNAARDPWLDPQYEGPADATAAGVPRGGRATQYRRETDAARPRGRGRAVAFGARLSRVASLNISRRPDPAVADERPPPRRGRGSSGRRESAAAPRPRIVRGRSDDLFSPPRDDLGAAPNRPRGGGGADARRAQAARLHRMARERNYGAEIETLKKERDELMAGVAGPDLRKWPAMPRFIEGGVIQKHKPDDGVEEEFIYAWEEVLRWRAHLVTMRALRRDLRCANCYVVAPKPPLKAMARCSLCRVARYCSAECQKKDWRVRHKAHCAGKRAKPAAEEFCEFCLKKGAKCVCGPA